MKLSLLDKIKLLDGADVWHTKSVSNLPQIMVADGPHGLRKQNVDGDNLGIGGSVPATAFPTASLLACSWDIDLISMVAKAIAKEAKAQKVNVVLGPGINIKRSPLCGRNFEYFSEDPYLTGILAASYVRAIEDSKVGCCVKHFCCNNQEKNRFTENSVVDERALYEIYLKAFFMCVKENPAMIMASYNKVNGYHSTESQYLMNILRKEWGYNGVVVTDWGASCNRINEVKAGCDLEMPSSNGYNTNKLLEASKNDEELVQAIETSAERIVELVQKYKDLPDTSFDIEEHHNISRLAASESMVLLKNEGVLPLKDDERIALISGFIDNMRFQGGGSSHINPTKVDQIIDIYQEYSSNIMYAKGFTLDGDGYDDKLFQEAIDVSKNVDKVVLIIGLPESYETEGMDRTSLELPSGQIKLLHEIAKVNPNLIVCVISGSVVNLSFSDITQGLLMCYLGGQASSKAILDILYGKVNPSGRLAETFIDTIDDCNVKLNDDDNVYYDESIFVGYRYYQTFNKQVRFPFGYGLSYTTFSYSNFTVSENDKEINIRFKLKNTGNYFGKEVVQVYLENNKSTVYKAKRELKRFIKVTLNPHEEKEITFKLTLDDFKYYDIYLHKYIFNKGKYYIQICKNASDVIYSYEYDIKDNPIDYQEHSLLSYHQEIYNPSDFNKLFSTPIPPRKEKIKRPYTLESTLNHLKKSFVGSLITKIIMKKAKRIYDNIHEEWLKKVMMETLFATPLRALSVMSGDELPLIAAEGIIDIANLHFLRGFGKLKKGYKK